MSFYDQYSSSWDSSRQKVWPGWEEMWQVQATSLATSTPAVLANKPIWKVLDLGCGNGRLLAFLLNKAQEQGAYLDYLGIDISGKLIDIAKQRFQNVNKNEGQNKDKKGNHKIRFECIDLIDIDTLKKTLNKNSPGEKYDLVIIMAVLHHFPDQNSRRALLDTVVNHLTTGGLITYTTWEFLSDPKTQKLIVKDEGNGDYLLSWQGKAAGPLRFAHAFTDDEKKQLAEHPQLTLLKAFFADGKNAKLNHYFTLSKHDT